MASNTQPQAPPRCGLVLLDFLRVGIGEETAYTGLLEGSPPPYDGIIRFLRIISIIKGIQGRRMKRFVILILFAIGIFVLRVFQPGDNVGNASQFQSSGSTTGRVSQSRQTGSTIRQRFFSTESGSTV